MRLNVESFADWNVGQKKNGLTVEKHKLEGNPVSRINMSGVHDALSKTKAGYKIEGKGGCSECS
jgi:hypothetical protein